MHSEYVYKGKLEWRRQGWRCSTGEVGHCDLWEQILWLREAQGGQSTVVLGSVASGTTWEDDL